MKKKITTKTKEFAKNAILVENGELKITLKPGETSSLGKVITNKEQADFFMKILKAL
jgi:hypothetical protein